MRHISLLLILALAGACAGCAGKKKDNTDSPPMPAKEPDQFERSADPPLNANTRFAAGQLAQSMGDIDRAAAQYREALKLDPKHRDALYSLGLILTQQRNFPEAVSTWKKYIEVTNHAPAAYNNLAYTYEVAGQLKEAEATYRACIERDPKQQACRVNYGRMLARYGRIDEAVQQMSAVLKPAEVTFNLGAVFEQQGKIDQAKAYYTKALEQDPNLRDAKARLAALK